MASPESLARASSDELALRMFTSRPRWVTTVGLQAFLGFFFLLAPKQTVALLEVTDIVETRTLFALYGGLLLHRAFMEQVVRSRSDPSWIRAYMWSSFPFGLSSAAILGWASLEGLMNPWIGWIWVILFVAEVVEFSVVLVKHRLETARSA